MDIYAKFGCVCVRKLIKMRISAVLSNELSDQTKKQHQKHSETVPPKPEKSQTAGKQIFLPEKHKNKREIGDLEKINLSTKINLAIWPRRPQNGISR